MRKTTATATRMEVMYRGPVYRRGGGPRVLTCVHIDTKERRSCPLPEAATGAGRRPGHDFDPGL